MNDGMVRRDSLDRKVDDIEDAAGNKKVCRNDIAYNMMRMWQGAMGVAPEDCLVSPAYVVLAPNKEAAPHFFQYLFKLPAMLQLLTSHSRGLTKDRLRLYFDDFAKMEFRCPKVKEQQRIADFLAAIDEYIATQTERLDILKTHKKGLMQQLFPCEGESQPRVRFPEFLGAREWGEQTLEQLVQIQSGATPSKENPEFWNGTVPWVSAKDMKQLYLDDAQDHISAAAIADGVKVAAPGTLLILTRGMTLLKDVPICLLRRKMSFNQDVKSLRPKEGVNANFLAWSLLAQKPRLLAMVDIAGHGTGKLGTDDLKAFVLNLPCLAEQQRIADCLTSLDELITAATQELDTLKTHKKGLMQQLFPAMDEMRA